jgi:hypothetical protein
MPGFHRGPPRNKGFSYPADPPTVEEIVAVMRCAGGRPPGLRTRAPIVLLWRAALRINAALAVAESDRDPDRQQRNHQQHPPAPRTRVPSERRTPEAGTVSRDTGSDCLLAAPFAGRGLAHTALPARMQSRRHPKH